MSFIKEIYSEALNVTQKLWKLVLILVIADFIYYISIEETVLATVSGLLAFFAWIWLAYLAHATVLKTEVSEGKWQLTMDAIGLSFRLLGVMIFTFIFWVVANLLMLTVTAIVTSLIYVTGDQEPISYSTSDFLPTDTGQLTLWLMFFASLSFIGNLFPAYVDNNPMGVLKAMKYRKGNVLKVFAAMLMGPGILYIISDKIYYGYDLIDIDISDFVSNDFLTLNAIDTPLMVIFVFLEAFITIITATILSRAYLQDMARQKELT